MNTRVRINIMTQTDAANLVSWLNRTAYDDTFVLETEDQKYRVDASSLLGVLYFLSVHRGNMYLVNCSNDNAFPEGIEQFID